MDVKLLAQCLALDKSSLNVRCFCCWGHCYKACNEKNEKKILLGGIYLNAQSMKNEFLHSENVVESALCTESHANGAPDWMLSCLHVAEVPGLVGEAGI